MLARPSTSENTPRGAYLAAVLWDRPAFCGCKIERSQFLQMIDEYSEISRGKLQPWTFPARLVHPLHWTCGAHAYHRVLVENSSVSADVDGSIVKKFAMGTDAGKEGSEHEPIYRLQLPTQAIDGDVLLVNGRIFTGDSELRWVEAIAIRDGSVANVGDTNEVMADAGTDAKVVDLGGRLVIPGFNDAHMHHTPDPKGIRLPIDPVADPSFNEIRPLIQQAVEESEPGTWIYGVMGETLINDTALNRLTLDEVSPRHPIILLGLTNHTNVVNSAAMKRLNIADDEPDPVGGFFERFPQSGRVSGRINEYAQWAPQRCFASMATIEEGAANISALGRDCVRWGITTIQNMSWTPIERYVDMVRAADIPIKVRVIRFPPAGPAGRLISEGRNLDREAGERLEVSGTKWILDGTTVERAAALGRDYADQLGNAGRENFSRNEVREMMREGLDFDDQTLLHAIGTAAIETLIAAAESFGSSVDWRKANLRIEHADGLNEDQMARVRALGATVVQNPTHFLFPEIYGDRFGSGSMFATFKTLIQADIPMGIGSDGPLNPFLGLYAAIKHPAKPDEALTLEQAICSYTHGSAVAEGKGHFKGRLMPGFVADLAVLSQDIFSVEERHIINTKSVLTMVDGKEVYRAS